ncbi:MAG TPA: PqqD family peptide modification chaperone [Pyrinomonadaceae bacterium]|nr:PqqD family peptide modification chaperone [Pyrinomonadaceae bacterium]
MRKAVRAQAPKARSKGLVIKKLADEVLVYDLETNKAHCLNTTAALVWNHCDGRKSVSEIAASLEANTLEQFTEEMVWLALNQLERFRLLEGPVKLPLKASGMSRRELVRKLGLAGAASLPLILSIVAPEAASAATCAGPGAPCLSNARCCSGLCVNGVCVCLGQNTDCASDAQCCSNRCGSALNKCLP